MGAAIPESWLEKFMIPPTLPTHPRGAISDGIDHPTGAAAERPLIEMLIQNRACPALCACAAPRMPSPKAVPPTSTTFRTRLEFHPLGTRKSTSHPPTISSTTVAESHGTPVYRNESRRLMCRAEER